MSNIEIEANATEELYVQKCGSDIRGGVDKAD